MDQDFPSMEFRTALAVARHPQMDPVSVADSMARLERRLMTALNEIGWEVRPMAAVGQTAAKE